MIRPATVVVTFLLLCPTAFSQKSESDPQTMQAVLSEIRQLRHDLQTAAIAARRAQIVIYRLHEETVAVERASGRLENTKNTLAQMQMQEEYQAAEIKRIEEYRDHAENEQQRKQLDDSATQFKEQMDAWVTQELQLRGKESEQEADFRAEQAKLERLEDELDRLDRDLEQTAVQASNR
jgi:chromosome segregation ATPase